MAKKYQNWDIFRYPYPNSEILGEEEKISLEVMRTFWGSLPRSLSSSMPPRHSCFLEAKFPPWSNAWMLDVFFQDKIFPRIWKDVGMGWSSSRVWNGLKIDEVWSSSGCSIKEAAERCRSRLQPHLLCRIFHSLSMVPISIQWSLAKHESQKQKVGFFGKLTRWSRWSYSKIQHRGSDPRITKNISWDTLSLL